MPFALQSNSPVVNSNFYSLHRPLKSIFVSWIVFLEVRHFGLLSKPYAFFSFVKKICNCTTIQLKRSNSLKMYSLICWDTRKTSFRFQCAFLHPLLFLTSNFISTSENGQSWTKKKTRDTRFLSCKTSKVNGTESWPNKV